MISWFYCHIDYIILFIGTLPVFLSVGWSVWKHPKGLAPCKEWVIKKFWEYWTKKIRITYLIIASVILYYLVELFFSLRDQLFLDVTALNNNQARNLALAFLGTISGIGALFGVFLAILRSETNERQTHTAEQGQITDRINKAIENLGKSNQKDKPVIEVRVGAIYALERIAQDSLRDHIKIIEILCAYIRHNSHEKGKKDELREDIHAAITIIGRRGSWPNGEAYLRQEKKERYHLDLYNCDLSNAVLNRANLSHAKLYKANLSKAGLDNADLSDSWFEDTVLNKTWLERAKTDRAWAYECDFSKCRGLIQEQLDVMFCSRNVKIPKELQYPAHWTETDLPFDKFQKKYWDWEKDQPNSYLKSKE